MRWLISRLSPPTLYKENGSTPTVKTGRSPFYKGLICFNSLITKTQMTKFSSANFKKMLSPSYIIFRIQRQRANSVVLVEMAYYTRGQVSVNKRNSVLSNYFDVSFEIYYVRLKYIDSIGQVVKLLILRPASIYCTQYL